MRKIVAKTLQEAITQASLELGCSVTELDYEIVQAPSKGFLGIGKKEAVIVATITKNTEEKKSSHQISPPPKLTTQTNSSKTSIQNLQKHDITHPNHLYSDGFEIQSHEIEENFFKEIQDPNGVIQEIETELKALFMTMPYKIDTINVSVYDSQTLLILLDGQDSALMIGEKGYRYKALSYLLFNWIHPKYGYNIRLEIAHFLKNQEEAMEIYLQGIIATIKESGKAQTKPLDGILAYIALKRLREIFPNKYVSFRINSLDERYIIISDFIKNE
ncbi:Jag N-terminal domain-containing protein [Helicobacter sp. 11S03491-1]|uniref:Jag N-terminal domain-containing protein n=1 Tax=Helicobacter sp. 11S03491-1 TaxID=1476196 RepID=UPI000BA5BB3B|nr:Jag N-terminal domain-containing protein [Helicobacter sp. 11S03491-1]PAF41704.1 hypothetical protein BKH45_06345 [Helicobacter sp. 11S03491-1]